MSNVHRAPLIQMSWFRYLKRPRNPLAIRLNSRYSESESDANSIISLHRMQTVLHFLHSVASILGEERSMANLLSSRRQLAECRCCFCSRTEIQFNPLILSTAFGPVANKLPTVTCKLQEHYVQEPFRLTVDKTANFLVHSLKLRNSFHQVLQQELLAAIIPRNYERIGCSLSSLLGKPGLRNFWIYRTMTHGRWELKPRGISWSTLMVSRTSWREVKWQ